MTYKIVSVIWEDHTRVDRQSIVMNPEDMLCTTITVGMLYKKTKKAYTILTDIERLPDRDEGTYMIILKSTVLGIKEFGEIEIDNLRITS